MSIQKLFFSINNHEWHDINELSEELDIPLTKLIEFFTEIKDKGIIEYQEKNNKIKLTKEWQKLLPIT